MAPEGLKESGQEDSTSKLEFRSPTLDPATLEVQTVTPDDSPMFLKKKPPESDPNLKKDEEIKKNSLLIAKKTISHPHQKMNKTSLLIFMKKKINIPQRMYKEIK